MDCKFKSDQRAQQHTPQNSTIKQNTRKRSQTRATTEWVDVCLEDMDTVSTLFSTGKLD